MGAIAMEQVRKTFGSKTAVSGIDLVVDRGGLYGFIGPNGAGKTTTIRMIMSIIFPDSGRLSVLGKASAVESKDQIGYLPEERGVYRKMKVSAFLEYMAKLKGLQTGQDLRNRVGVWLEKVGLENEAKKKCEELSKGMQQKVQFIASVIHEPELLILDEPFSGLDPVNMRLMRDLFLEQHNRGATIIFSTHVMHQAEQLCDHIVMIHRGDKVLDDTLDAIRSKYTGREVAFEPIDPSTGPRAVGEVAGVERVDKIDGIWRAQIHDASSPQEALPKIAAAVPMRRIEVLSPSLEDIFVEIAGVGHDELHAGKEDLPGSTPSLTEEVIEGALS